MSAAIANRLGQQPSGAERGATAEEGPVPRHRASRFSTESLDLPPTLPRVAARGALGPEGPGGPGGRHGPARGPWPRRLAHSAPPRLCPDFFHRDTASRPHRPHLPPGRTKSLPLRGPPRRPFARASSVASSQSAPTSAPTPRPSLAPCSKTTTLTHTLTQPRRKLAPPPPFFFPPPHTRPV